VALPYFFILLRPVAVRCSGLRGPDTPLRLADWRMVE
jgi:hypothetical protein